MKKNFFPEIYRMENIQQTDARRQTIISCQRRDASHSQKHGDWGTLKIERRKFEKKNFFFSFSTNPKRKNKRWETEVSRWWSTVVLFLIWKHSAVLHWISEKKNFFLKNFPRFFSLPVFWIIFWFPKNWREKTERWISLIVESERKTFFVLLRFFDGRRCLIR